jgi:hypothetical protein
MEWESSSQLKELTYLLRALPLPEGRVFGIAIDRSAARQRAVLINICGRRKARAAAGRCRSQSQIVSQEIGGV